LHVAWDDAGCLCPIGDLFNYAAPDDDISSEEQDTEETMKCQEKSEMLEDVKFSCSSESLTDGGYEDSKAYCLYARKMYRKGEQVCSKYCTRKFSVLAIQRITLRALCFLKLGHYLGTSGVWDIHKLGTS
jgi:hypothetical protein